MNAAACPDLDNSAPRSSRLPHPTFATVLKVAVAALLMAAIYWRVLLDMALDWWTDPSLSQGLLIPPLAAYIAWTRWNHIARQPAAPDNRGLWMVGLACVSCLLGKLGAEFFLSRISFVILLAGLAWTFWGAARLRLLGFPLLLLATMVPIPVIVYNALAAPLQLFASNISTNLAQMLGISVYRDGNIIHLAHISLGVEEACSGLNSLSALTIASLLLGFLMCTRVSTRVILFLLAIPFAIAVNILRITGTAVIADYHEEFALGFYHSFSGWLVFVLGFGILYATAALLHRVLEGVRSR